MAILAGGGGWYLVSEVRATIAEQDLSRIGNGIPAVVQIHDPQCPRCLALQRETRKAMSGFADDELQKNNPALKKNFDAIGKIPVLARGKADDFGSAEQFVAYAPEELVHLALTVSVRSG